MKIARSDSAIKLSYWDWCGLPLIHVAAKTISEQALSAFHSQAGRRNFWGLLHCDHQRLPWWPRCDQPQHDRSCSDTDMICMNFNIFASLFMFCITPVLFCFVFLTRNYVYNMGVSCVWFLLPYISRLGSNWAWKPFKLRLSISFSLLGFSSLLTL